MSAPALISPAASGATSPLTPGAHTNAPRLHYLDGLRAVAALTVVVNHVFQQVFWLTPAQGLLGRLAPWLQLGHYSVVLFITLSGFCLMLPVLSFGSLRGGVRRFYAARARRILPAYYAAMLFALLLIGTLVGRPHGAMFDISLHPTWRGILGHVLLVQNLWPPPFRASAGNTQVCSVFWSIALEWQIYFLFPLFLLLWRRLSPLWAMPVIIAGALLARLATDALSAHGLLGLNWQGLNLDFYVYFAGGMLAATIAFSPQSFSPRLRLLWARLPWAGMALALAMGFVLLLHNLVRGRWSFDGKWLDYYCAPLFLCLLVAASRPGALERALSWRPLVRVGEYSYSVYLLHLPVIAVLTDYVALPLRDRLGGGKDFVLLLALSVPLVLWFAYRSALIFENKRVIARALEWVSRKPATTSVSSV